MSRFTTWNSNLPPAFAPRVNEACNAWVGTPYRKNAQVRGGGADCLTAVTGVMDDVRQMPHATEPLPFAFDLGTQGYEKMRVLVEWLKKRYGLVEIHEGPLEPLDFLLTRSQITAKPGDDLGHVAACTGQADRIFHSTNAKHSPGSGAQILSSASFRSLTKIEKVWRMPDNLRFQWI